MEKVLIKSIIAAFVIEITGAAVNLFSYFVYGKFLLAKQLYGGEWMGWAGFALSFILYPLSFLDFCIWSGRRQKIEFCCFR